MLRVSTPAGMLLAILFQLFSLRDSIGRTAYRCFGGGHVRPIFLTLQERRCRSCGSYTTLCGVVPEEERLLLLHPLPPMCPSRCRRSTASLACSLDGIYLLKAGNRSYNLSHHGTGRL